MKILYLDTSSNYLYAGVVSNDRLLREIKLQLDKELSIFTLPKIKQLLEDAYVKPTEIDKIIVTNGPGSFTGIRIGMTIAKTFCWALNIPLITITSLEAMSLSVITDKKYFVPIIDARRNYVYSAIYSSDYSPILKNQHIKIEELENHLKKIENQFVIITNDQIEIAGAKLPYNPDILKIVMHFKSRKPVDPHIAEPEYLKKTEAEERLSQ